MKLLDKSPSTHDRNRWKSVGFLVWVALLVSFFCRPASVSAAVDAASPAAVVTVVTEPDIGGGTFRFTGTPSGELTVVAGEQRSLAAGGLAPGNHTSTLAVIDPMVLAAGYTLTDIRCDDMASQERSNGNVDSKTATFRIEDGETVICTYVLSAAPCICPKEGRWNVSNHTGSMVCTGTMSMTVPLKASSGSGTLDVRDGCSTIIASGMSEEEATIEMHAVDGCGFAGSVGGSQDGISMIIHFTWDVLDSERITGELHSTVTEQGTTCNMNRTYELTFSSP